MLIVTDVPAGEVLAESSGEGENPGNLYDTKVYSKLNGTDLLVHGACVCICP